MSNNPNNNKSNDDKDGYLVCDNCGNEKCTCTDDDSDDNTNPECDDDTNKKCNMCNGAGEIYHGYDCYTVCSNCRCVYCGNKQCTCTDDDN
jgi:hypothetical protein